MGTPMREQIAFDPADLVAADPQLRHAHELTTTSTVLIVVTEGV